jgi:hypothetical protein
MSSRIFAGVLQVGLAAQEVAAALAMGLSERLLSLPAMMPDSFQGAAHMDGGTPLLLLQSHLGARNPDP